MKVAPVMSCSNPKKVLAPLAKPPVKLTTPAVLVPLIFEKVVFGPDLMFSNNS